MKKPKSFRPWQPDQTTLLPPSPREWLAEDHQVYFLLDLVDELDLSEILIPAKAKDPRGEKGFDPRMMTMLLLYAYCVGTVSSRKIERACYEDLAFRVLTGNQQPDHSRISDFRRRNLDALKGLFVQILRLCQKAGMVSLGHVALDGTKVKANASKHKAMSHERMLRAEKQLAQEINALCQATAKTGPEATRKLVHPEERARQDDKGSAGPPSLEPMAVETAVQTPQDVEAMQRLSAAGWGRRRIARELGCSPETVRKYLRQGGWQPYGKPCRNTVLDGQREWLRQRFLAHRGNADVVRQELASEKGIKVSLRTVERAVEPWRRELRNAALATVRFETPPGRQLQADFGQCLVSIGGERVRVHLAVLTLGYSRRLLVRAFRSEKQDHWLQTLEEGFRHWGGVPQEVLVDNARALVSQHDPEQQILVFAQRLEEFASYWGFKPRACRPYRARTKGKDERGVAYVKRNAIAGREFSSWAELEAHLVRWSREVADLRVHGTTGEAPLERYLRAEAQALQPLPDKPSFLAERELVRIVHSDCCGADPPWRPDRR